MKNINTDDIQTLQTITLKQMSEKDWSKVPVIQKPDPIVEQTTESVGYSQSVNNDNVMSLNSDSSVNLSHE